MKFYNLIETIDPKNTTPTKKELNNVIDRNIKESNDDNYIKFLKKLKEWNK